jgi:hypothetical protein
MNALLGPVHAKVLLQTTFVGNPTGPFPTTFAHQTELDADFVMLPQDQPSVTFVHDESIRSAIEASLFVQPQPHYRGNDLMTMGFGRHALPIDMAGTVVLRANGREWIAYSNTFHKSNSSIGNSELFECSVPGLTADHIDVIFKPDLKVAAGTLDVTQIWDGEVVIKNVPVNGLPAK